MARVIRKNDPTRVATTAAFEELKTFVVAQLRLAAADGAANKAVVAAYVQPTLVDFGAHNDRSETTITAANASNLATSLTLVNQILGVYAFHMADTCAHKVTGVALASYTPVTTLANAIIRANDIKAKYNTHRASTTYHYTADSTNVVTSADATDQTSLNTLLNEIKTDINAHLANGVSAKSIRLG